MNHSAILQLESETSSSAPKLLSDNRCPVAREAERRMQSSAYCDLRCVRCKCQNGVLMLEGQVESFYLKQLAQESLRGIEGISLIVNGITVAEPSNIRSPTK